MSILTDEERAACLAEFAAKRADRMALANLDEESAKEFWTWPVNLKFEYDAFKNWEKGRAFAELTLQEQQYGAAMLAGVFEQSMADGKTHSQDRTSVYQSAIDHVFDRIKNCPPDVSVILYAANKQLAADACAAAAAEALDSDNPLNIRADGGKRLSDCTPAELEQSSAARGEQMKKFWLRLKFVKTVAALRLPASAYSMIESCETDAPSEPSQSDIFEAAFSAKAGQRYRQWQDNNPNFTKEMAQEAQGYIIGEVLKEMEKEE
jgi:hypothetical protein